MIRNLPPDSALHRAMAGDEGWTVTDHLVRNVIDLMQGLAWQNANRGVERHKQSAYPKPFPSPAMRAEAEQTQQALMDRLDAMDHIPI